MSRYRSIILFLLLSVFWGGSFVSIEVGLETYPPILFAAYRFDLAAVVLLTYVFITDDGPLPETRSDLIAIVLSGGLIVAGNNALLFLGQQFTTSGIAAITYSLVPIVTAAVAATTATGSKLDAYAGVGVFCGLAGVALIAQPDPSNLVAGAALGVSLVFIGVIAVSVGSVGLRDLQTTTTSLAMTGWAMLFGALVLHTVSVGIGEPTQIPSLEPAALTALVFLGVFSSAMAYSIYFTLLDQLGPFQINLVSYLVPIIATITGWALLGEPITTVTVSGFVLVVSGFALVKRRAIQTEFPRIRARLF